MKMNLQAELEQVLAQQAGRLGAKVPGSGAIERPRDPGHGDFASSLAMRIAKGLGKKPREVAESLAAAVNDHAAVARTEIAGPGFVNITLAPAARCAVLGEILEKRDRFGAGEPSGQSMLLEFVSANPTGPVHVGHGRAAAVGDSLARILRFAGTKVATEYYLNDRGLQTDVLAASLWLRVLMEQGALEMMEMPEGSYAGDYLAPVAKEFIKANPGVKGGAPDLGNLPDEPEQVGAELASRAKEALGEDFAVVRDYVVESMTNTIKEELADFGVHFDRWSSEREVFDSGKVRQAIDRLTELGHTYEQDGALWFRSSSFGDEKDWVVVRGNGETTYFAADIAYHLEKAGRGLDIIYDLLGSDHHGYVPRLRASLAALGKDPGLLEVGIVQFVSLVNAQGRIPMSTRKGDFIPLAELVDSVGTSAARLFYVLSKAEAPIDFDVRKATAVGAENPVYYMQYAHARSCRLLERWGGDAASLGDIDPGALDDDDAKAVMTELRWFATTVQAAARERAPHRIAHWLVALASALHGFYDRVQVLGGEEDALASRLALVAATRQALANGMGLLGVEAPNKM